VQDSLVEAWGAFSEEEANDPYPLYAELRRQGPVRRVVLADGRPAWLVTRYEEARQALTDPRLYKDSERAREANPDAVSPRLRALFAGRNMLAADPPEHTRLRTIVSNAFTPSRIEGLRPRVGEIADAILDEMAGRPQADLIASFAFPLPVTVICDLLGVPLAHRDSLRTWITAMFGAPPTPAGDAEALEASDRLCAYLSRLLAAKQEHPGDDLLSGLVAASHDGERLGDAEVLSTTFLLVTAGHDTTVNLIGNGTAALLRHPDQLAALRADESLIPSAVEEFLRFDGPVHHATFRFTAEPLELAGVSIPANQPVLVVLAGADRDPERFPDPDRLDVRRPDNRHLAFGHGIHFCLGAPLARLEGQIAFASLLRRFPELRLAVEPGELRWRHGLVLRGLRELPVTLGPAAPSS